MIRLFIPDPYPGSGSWFFTHPVQDTGVKKAPDPGSWIRIRNPGTNQTIFLLIYVIDTCYWCRIWNRWCWWGRAWPSTRAGSPSSPPARWTRCGRTWAGPLLSLLLSRYKNTFTPVLRIRDVYPGSWFLSISDLKTATFLFCGHKDHKNVNYFIFELVRKNLGPIY